MSARQRGRMQKPWLSMPRATLNLLRLSKVSNNPAMMRVAGVQMVAGSGTICHLSATALLRSA